MGTYIYTKNDDFSDALQGGYLVQSLQRFGNGFFNKDKTIISHPFTFAQSLQDGRNAEGFVYVNGRRIPGIFTGFEVNGGLNLEKFNKDSMENTPTAALKKGLKTGEIVATFSTLRGSKPISGHYEFILLDDDYSTALEKSNEFVKIVTHWQDGEASKVVSKKLGSDKPFPQIFLMESFLIGEGRPFNFKNGQLYVYIPDYKLTMANSGIEGRIDAAFQFEQFNIFYDKESAKPKTEKIGNDAGDAIGGTDSIENPMLEGITP